jgi:hypothetical protein
LQTPNTFLEFGLALSAHSQAIARISHNISILLLIIKNEDEFHSSDGIEGIFFLFELLST